MRMVKEPLGQLHVHQYLYYGGARRRRERARNEGGEKEMMLLSTQPPDQGELFFNTSIIKIF